MHLVFTQAEDGAVDVERVAHHASRFFDADVQQLGREKAGRDGELERTRFSFRSGRAGLEAQFSVTARPVAQKDLRAARDAEARGQVPGMGALAERCKHVWEVRVEDDGSERALDSFCAVLASVALGPILPPDHATLLGVRSARERAAGNR